MSTKRATPPPLICVNCGDELVIVAHYLPTGPLCADCHCGSQEPVAPTTTNTPLTAVPPRAAEGPSDGTDQGMDDKGEIGIKSEARDRAALSRERADPRDFDPETGAVGLVIEVEEWVWIGGSTDEGDFVRGTRYPLATPADLSLPELAILKAWSDLPTFSRFVVVLEWERASSEGVHTTLRDIGPTFGGDRQQALTGAIEFARGQARRLKANGPFGYKPAREIPGRLVQGT